MNKNLGFTLIELLVVVLIIGILAAIAVPQYQFAVNKARYAELLTALNSWEKQAKLAYLEGGFTDGDDSKCAFTPFLEDGSGNGNSTKWYVSLEQCDEDAILIDTHNLFGNFELRIKVQYYSDMSKDYLMYYDENDTQATKLANWLQTVDSAFEADN